MKNARIWVGIVFLFVAVGYGGGALASPEADALTDGARSDFAAARYAGALDKFLRAHALNGEPKLLWNAAACERKLGHNGKAIRYLERYLETAPDLSEQERAEVEDTINAVGRYVALASIESDPAGARVYVDEEVAGVTPLDGVLLDPGTHEIVLELEGYGTLKREVSVAGGDDPTWTFSFVQGDGTAGEGAPIPPIALMAGGAAVATVGAILLGVSIADFGTFEEECAPSCDPAAWESSESMNTAGTVLLALGGASAVAGLTWALWPAADEPDAASVWLAPLPGGIAVGGRW